MITRKLKFGIIIGSTVVVGGSVAAAIGVPASMQHPFEVQYFESGAALQSLNHVIRADTAYSNIYGFFMEGILATGNPTDTKALVSDYTQRGYKNYVPYKIQGTEQDALKNPTGDAYNYSFQQESFDDDASYDPVTGDSLISPTEFTPAQIKDATGVYYSNGITDVIESNITHEKDESFRARVNPDAYWSNGDKIKASDFVATIKYMLDSKNASYGAQQVYETIHLKGARKIYDMQQKDDDPANIGKPDYYGKKKTFEEAWKFASEHDSIGIPVKVDGTDNRWVHYIFDGQLSFTGVIPYLGGAQFMPIDEKFVESIGGITKYGQNIETTLSDGPYKISSMDLDYMVTFERNNYYYAPELVLIDHPGYKVAPSSAIQLQLFKEGKLSNMDVPTSLLASIYKTPNLVPLLGHGGTAPRTQGISFSKYYSDLHGGPTADENFRKAIMYGINRNEFAEYTNNTGGAPANSLFAPRSSTTVSDENGQNYYRTLGQEDYKEKDPITGKTIDGIKFDAYDPATKYSAAYSAGHNVDYEDYLYNKTLANDFLKKYFETSGKTSVDFTIDIVASEENNYLSIKELLDETFDGKVNILPNLVSSQVMTEESQNGKYQTLFNSFSTSIDDPYALYAKFITEDGYRDPENHLAYTKSKNRDGSLERSMEVTSRYWNIPGFSVPEMIKSWKKDGSIDERISRYGITQAQFNIYEKALSELTIHHDSPDTSESTPPTYKYDVATKLTEVSSDQIKGYLGTDGKPSVNIVSPFIDEDGSIKTDQIFKHKSDLFGFYRFIEKAVRDSGYFVPTISTTSAFFLERRGLRMPGTQEGMPYGYRYIYPKDNQALIDSIEKRLKEKYGVTITLQGV